MPSSLDGSVRGKPSAYALVVLADHARPKLEDAAFKKQVETDLGGLLEQINAKVSGYEQLQMLVVAKEPWSIESGTLTPTMKLKRAKIEAAVEPHLDAWYDAKRPVVWA